MVETAKDSTDINSQTKLLKKRRLNQVTEPKANPEDALDPKDIVKTDESGRSPQWRNNTIAGLIERHRRFLTLHTSKSAPIWMYNKERGVWLPNGESIIRQEAANWTSPACSNHTKNEVVALLRDRYWIDTKSKVGLDKVILGNPKYAHRIVLQNGIYDLKKHKFSVEFAPNEYHITAVPITYDSQADCPKFKEFLTELLPDEKDRLAILEFFGYCLYKDYPSSNLMALYGPTRCGKSTLLRVLGAFVGEENRSSVTPWELMFSTFAKAQLFRKLVNISSDIPDKKMFVSQINRVTGGDSFQAQRKNQPLFDMMSYAKQIFSANDLPVIVGASQSEEAFYGRLRLIEFKRKFEAGSTDTIPQDVLVASVTTPEELSGQLNLALEGFKRLEKNNFLFSGERTLTLKKARYLIESDTVKYFVDRYITSNPRAFVIQKSQLYEWYCSSCNFIGKHPVSKSEFGKRIKRYVSGADGSKKATVGRGNETERIRVWSGVEFNTKRWDADWKTHEGIEDDDEDEDEPQGGSYEQVRLGPEREDPSYHPEDESD